MVQSSSDDSTDEKNAIVYEAKAASPIVNGDVKVKLNEKSFTVSGLFDAAEVSFVDFDGILLENHIVSVDTDAGRFSLSKMGNWALPFYDAFCEAYHKRVLKAFFVSGKPLAKAEGEYRFNENGRMSSGKASIHVYESSVIALTPDANAKRIPLCFLTGMDKGSFEATLSLGTGEKYTFSKLGYGTDVFANAVEKQIREIREKTLATVKELDPSMGSVQAAQIAKLLPEGVAAPMGKIRAASPSFAAALETKIDATRAVDYYKMLKQLCDPSKIWIGLKKNDDRFPAETEQSGDGEEREPDPFMIWMIAPSPDGQYAVVEFAAADTATFIYKTGGDFDRFAMQINQALEAISFRREVIRLSDEDLLKPDNFDYLLAAKRTASLQFIRSKFAARAIHSNPEAWKRKLTETWNSK